MTDDRLAKLTANHYPTPQKPGTIRVTDPTPNRAAFERFFRTLSPEALKRFRERLAS